MGLKLREAIQGAPRISQVIHGSIVMVKRFCGGANCRCQKGHKHCSMYISQRYKGKTRMIYIPKRSESRVRCYVSNYQKFKMVMDQVTEINIQQLTKG